MPKLFFKAAALPSEKILLSFEQWGQMKPDMFSMAPRMGTLSFLNMATALRTSERAIDCGVVTITEPAIGTVWHSVS